MFRAQTQKGPEDACSEARLKCCISVMLFLKSRLEMTVDRFEQTLEDLKNMQPSEGNSDKQRTQGKWIGHHSSVDERKWIREWNRAIETSSYRGCVEKGKTWATKMNELEESKTKSSSELPLPPFLAQCFCGAGLETPRTGSPPARKLLCHASGIQKLPPGSRPLLITLNLLWLKKNIMHIK